MVRPVIVHARVDTDAGEHVFAGETATPPEVKAVTVYAVTEAPPLSSGAAQVKDTCALPTVPTTVVGGPGFVVAGMTPLLALEDEPGPMRFEAFTVNV